MHVLFTVAGRMLATDLADVREVVRGAAVERLPGCEPPYVGALQLRGVTVPVADARPTVDVASGDVLVVLESGRAPMGVLVDRAVSIDDDGHSVVLPAPEGLPAYVQGLVERDGAMVPVVGLRALAQSAAMARGWGRMAGSAAGGAPGQT